MLHEKRLIMLQQHMTCTDSAQVEVDAVILVNGTEEKLYKPKKKAFFHFLMSF